MDKTIFPSGQVTANLLIMVRYLLWNAAVSGIAYS